jgi:hypothetical protein
MSYDRHTLLLSQGQASASQIVNYLRSSAPAGLEFVRRKHGQADLPLHPIPAGLGEQLITECHRYADRSIVVNHDVVAAQVALESASVQSILARDPDRVEAVPSGLLPFRKRNLVGYGAEPADPLGKATTFPSYQACLRTLVAHLLGYALGDGPWNADSPRYPLVVQAGNAGQVRALADLEQRYAWDPPATYAATPISDRYGSKLAARANALLATSDNDDNGGTMADSPISNLTDIRGRLATKSPGEDGVERGPYERCPLNEKRGIVVHFRGVVTRSDPDPGFSSFAADAIYHVGKNWAKDNETPVYGSGIMYHIGIGFDGTAYLMRDLDRVLWHCGAWPQNTNTLAIQLPLGLGQRPTNRQLATLKRVCDEWLAFTGAPKSEVWGHKELSSSDCPGELMDTFVKPYRNDTTPLADPNHRRFTEYGGQSIINLPNAAMLNAWNAKGGLTVCGYPIHGMIRRDNDQAFEQEFENVLIELYPDGTTRFGGMGQRLLAARERIASLEERLANVGVPVG